MSRARSRTSSPIHICVVGAGPVGLAIALELQELGYVVTILADQLPNQGITGDFAAGIGCIFKPSSRQVAELVLESYESWMKLAVDPSCEPVAETLLRAVARGPDPTWAPVVREFARIDPNHIIYRTYAFNPAALGLWRLRRFRERGGSLAIQPLPKHFVPFVRNYKTFPGWDYTVFTMGLRLRSILPALGLFPVRGVLVHFDEAPDMQSFMDEDACSYVVQRPQGLVVGGTFDPYVDVCPEEDQRRIGKNIVEDANRRFGLNLDFNRHTHITVGYRPAISGDLILEFGAEVAIVNGLGGQGWVTGPALSKRVARQVSEILAKRRR